MYLPFIEMYKNILIFNGPLNIEIARYFNI